MEAEIKSPNMSNRFGTFMKILGIFILVLFQGGLYGQVEFQSSDSSMKADLKKTLDAQEVVALMAFAFQGIGIGCAVAANFSFQPVVPLSVTAFIGSGGNGMEISNAKLAKTAYRQIDMLTFTPEDSLVKRRMLSNMRTAKKLATIQFFAPFLAAATGGVAYLISGSNDKVFIITTLTLYSIGILTVVPQIVLIENTRKDMMNYHRKLTVGQPQSGIGISYVF